MESFDSARKRLEKQYEHVVYDPESGLDEDGIRTLFEAHCRENPQEEHVLTKAFLLHLVCTKARIAPEPDNFFAGKVDPCVNLFRELRRKWLDEVWEKEFSDHSVPQNQKMSVVDMDHSIGYMIDTSHTSPDWPAILKLGFPGLRNRAAKGSSPLHRAAEMVYDGAVNLCRRLGKASGNEALPALAERPPQTLREAFQLAYLFHDLQEIEGEEVRTMGWFDRLYLNFYRNDLKAGRLTRESAKELIKYFWIAFYAKWQGKRFGKNFCFGPEINELSYLGMEIYHEMNTVDPKLSVLVTADTPPDFLELAAKNIRDGRNGIVFLNNKVVIEGLVSPMRLLGSYFVIVFFASQMFACFNYSHLDKCLAVWGADLLMSVNAGSLGILLLFILFVAFVNLFWVSATSKWAFMAYICVPVLAEAGIAPDVVQAAFRVGDSATNTLTPFMFYVPLVLAYMQYYDKRVTYGSLLRYTWRYSFFILLAWMLLFVVWYVGGLAFGL